MKKILLLISLFFIFVGLSFAQNPIKDIDKSDSNKVSSPVRILYKPRAAYPKSEKGAICVTGTVTLKVQFLDSGKIGEIDVVNGLPLGLTENAVNAAKNIKFKPAQRNGKSITVFKTVSFSFSIY